MGEVEQAIRAFITDEFLDGRQDVELRDDQSLIDAEILDSLGIFTLVEFIEERFGLAIAPEDILLEHFETLGAIRELVVSRLAGQPAG